MSKVVLVTGCSTGIGRHLVQRMSQSGYMVVATARKAETLNDLPAALKLPLTFDTLLLRAVVALGIFPRDDRRDRKAISAWADGLLPMLLQ